MLAVFLDDIRDRDMIAPRRMAERLRLPLSRLAQIVHVNRNTMTARPDSVAVQTKLGEIARIIARRRSGGGRGQGDHLVQASADPGLWQDRRGTGRGRTRRFGD